MYWPATYILEVSQLTVIKSLNDYHTSSLYPGTSYTSFFFVAGSSRNLLKNPGLPPASPSNSVSPPRLYGMPFKVVAWSLRCRNMKNATIAAIIGTPSPMPTPRPIFNPVLEEEVSPVPEGETIGVELDPKGDVMGEEVVGEAMDEVDEVLVVGILIVLGVELETPIVAARTTLLLMAQHCSEVKPLPQHQVPSVKHCVIPMFSLGDPPAYSNQRTILTASTSSSSAYGSICTNSF